jgi:hypothetical protein
MLSVYLFRVLQWQVLKGLRSVWRWNQIASVSVYLSVLNYVRGKNAVLWCPLFIWCMLLVTSETLAWQQSVENTMASGKTCVDLMNINGESL